MVFGKVEALVGGKVMWWAGLGCGCWRDVRGARFILWGLRCGAVAVTSLTGAPHALGVAVRAMDGRLVEILEVKCWEEGGRC